MSIEADVMSRVASACGPETQERLALLVEELLLLRAEHDAVAVAATPIYSSPYGQGDIVKLKAAHAAAKAVSDRNRGV